MSGTTSQPYVPSDKAIVDTKTGIPTRVFVQFMQAIVRTFFKGDPAGRALRWGTGTPEGVVTAPIGDVFLRKDGGASTVLYVKESGTGATGWVAK